MIRFDPLKRLGTLEQRGLDFLDAESVFAGPTIEASDRRKDYGEVRIICFGLLRGRAVIVVYTERNGIRHIISMRKANEREQRRFLPHLYSR
ncbi:BrnT family toxin [Synechococcus sp. CS-1327]|nr:BrnT family toxin [Synechococcus sp. CS-1326]MCT0232846.1 BrnT family toxin [Synechococcus sp. CS-1327]